MSISSWHTTSKIFDKRGISHMNMRTVSTDDGVEYWFDVTESIQGILGDIVQSAEIMMTNLPNTTNEKDKNNILNMYSINIEQRNHRARKMHHFNFDQHPLEITFTNGRKIRMHGTEWASFRLMNYPD